uniref:Uncharacterized protein K0031E03.10 n=1 Tax=Oryza sativa subsp. indica TaxID=39946 RepID=C8TEW1_ORYSI|nr:hypothetical protein [Oryza sativa Indica Group]BAI39731.1 hypothetical protein [Oryza sativa Indica Group]
MLCTPPAAARAKPYTADTSICLPEEKIEEVTERKYDRRTVQMLVYKERVLFDGRGRRWYHKF